MNNRIQKLAEKAKKSVPHGLSVDKWIETYNQNFAELIVKECAYLVNHQQRTTGYTTHAKMLCDEFGIEFKDEDFFGVKE